MYAKKDASLIKKAWKSGCLFLCGLITAMALCMSAMADEHSYDPSSDTTPPAVISYLRAHEVAISPIPPTFANFTSWQATSPSGQQQNLYVYRDGLTFVAGSEVANLAENEQPGQPNVMGLGEIAPDVEGWLPRSWAGQSLTGVLYVVKGYPTLLKGYAYRFFPERDIIDNLSALQLLQNSAKK